jgi:hypothetical protein
MPLTIDDQIISLVDVSSSYMDVRSGSLVNTVSQSMFLIGGISGSNPNFIQLDNQGSLIITGSATVNQGRSGSLGSPWPILLTSGGIQTGISGSPITVTGSIAVTNTPLTVQFGSSGGGIGLSKLINLSFNASDGAIVANKFKRVVTYTTPTGFYGYLISFSSWQNEVANSRFVAETNLAQLNINTNTFTAGESYVNPQWSANVEADVTTALAAGSGNVKITVTYTNETGVGSRTGTISIPKGSAVGSRWVMVLQAGDIGVRSIQNLSASPTQVGVIRVLGFILLAQHQDENVAGSIMTDYAPGAISFPSGTVVGIEYSGGTVSKQRIFNSILQILT